MFALFTVLSIVIIESCVTSPNSIDEVQSKYSILLGSATISVTDRANSYEVKDGMISYYSLEDSMQVQVPKCNVFMIATNNQ